MVIKKEYNIEKLASRLKSEVEKLNRSKSTVSIDIITAIEIIDVLCKMVEIEKKYQKPGSTEKILVLVSFMRIANNVIMMNVFIGKNAWSSV